MSNSSPIQLNSNYIASTLIPNYNLVAGRTELGSTPVYQFSYAGGSSSYSFGLYQYNVGTNSAAAQFLLNAGFTQAQVNQLSQSGGLSAAQVQTMSTQLQTALQNSTNAAALGTLNSNWAAGLVTQLQNALNNIYQTNPSIADQIYQSQSLQLALLDYANQFNLGATGALEQYLAALPSTTQLSLSSITNYIMTQTTQGTNPTTRTSQQNRENSLTTEVLTINPSNSVLLVTGNVSMSMNNVTTLLAPGISVNITGSGNLVSMGNGASATVSGNGNTATCGSSGVTLNGVESMSCSSSTLNVSGNQLTGAVTSGSSVNLSGSGNSLSLGTGATVDVRSGTSNTFSCNGTSETVNGTGNVSCSSNGLVNGSGISVTSSSGSGSGSGSGTGTGDSGGDSGSGDGGDGGGGGEGCVEISSYLLDGTQAIDVKEGDEIALADEKSLQADRGVVTYSKTKIQPGYRIVTRSGISLRCSASAPIPTPDGLFNPAELHGKSVATLRIVDGKEIIEWEPIESIEFIGDISVQHISVNDKCFWAGESVQGFILHHNKIPVDEEAIKANPARKQPSVGVNNAVHQSSINKLIDSMASFSPPAASSNALHSNRPLMPSMHTDIIGGHVR